MKSTAEWVARESGKEADMPKIKKQLRCAFQASKVRHEREIQAERTIEPDKRVHPYSGEFEEEGTSKRKRKSAFVRKSKRLRKSSKQTEEETDPEAGTSSGQNQPVYEISDTEEPAQDE